MIIFFYSILCVTGGGGFMHGPFLDATHGSRVAFVVQ